MIMTQSANIDVVIEHIRQHIPGTYVEKITRHYRKHLVEQYQGF